jgi:hypothetical protein
MATVGQIATLRLYIAEPTADEWTDLMLGTIIDASATLDAAAIEVWSAKAASLADAVDISEGGSSRKNSDLLKNALLMLDLFKGRSVVDSGTRIGKLTRT